MADTIQFYGAGWCPDSRRSRKCLDRLGIPYDYRDIDEDAKAFDYARSVNNGRPTVPTILFPDGSILVEPSDAALEAKCRGETAPATTPEEQAETCEISFDEGETCPIPGIE